MKILSLILLLFIVSCSVKDYGFKKNCIPSGDECGYIDYNKIMKEIFD